MLDRCKKQLTGAGITLLVLAAVFVAYHIIVPADIQTMGIGSQNMASSTTVDAIQADIGDPSARTNFQDLENMIGIPDAANSNVDDILRTGYDSSGITEGANGSMLERLEVIQVDTAVITGAATLGLNDTADSVSYRLGEIDRHVHSYERWFGVAAAPSGTTNCADSISGGASSLQADAGNNAWGSWLCILGTADSPAIAGSAYFDLHRISVVAVERNGATHLIQMGCGSDYTTTLSGGTYSEAVFEPPTAASGNELPIVVQQRRQTTNTACWIRAYIPGQNTGTLDFYIGIHEYEN